jgi:ATP-dependent DNA helicase RecQ
VIDEAHCVSEWGETFRPAYQDLPRIIDASKAPLITAFTATASAPVLEKIEASIFGGQKVRRIIGNPDRPAIRYEALGCILRDLAVRDLIIKNQRPAIVFCSSRKGTEKLARYLRNELQDKNIRFYHAGLNKEEKNGIENWFFAHPQGVLTATCAYGMGVDKADVRTVIHRDCPPSAEAYLQESGRAGRDGAPARAILLWGPEDNRALGPSESEINRIRRSALFAYARNTQECRRTALLKLLDYRGAVEYPQSGCCDVCENQALSSLREEPRLTAFFTQNRRRYSVSAAADRLSQAGALRWSDGDAKKAILQLIDQNSLICPSKGLWKNTITVPYSFLKSAYGFIAGLKGPRKSG